MFCKEFDALPSELEKEDHELLYRIVQIRGYERMREAMRTEKQREKDAKPSGPIAELVAKVQKMLQDEDDQDESNEPDDDEEED